MEMDILYLERHNKGCGIISGLNHPLLFGNLIL
jgi:hypothetical protein